MDESQISEDLKFVWRHMGKIVAAASLLVTICGTLFSLRADSRTQERENAIQEERLDRQGAYMQRIEARYLDALERQNEINSKLGKAISNLNGYLRRKDE